MFTDYPDFCNSGSPAAAGLCTEDVISKAILHKIILILYLACLFKAFYFPILKTVQAVSTLAAPCGVGDNLMFERL